MQIAVKFLFHLLADSDRFARRLFQNILVFAYIGVTVHFYTVIQLGLAQTTEQSELFKQDLEMGLSSSYTASQLLP